MRVAVFGAGPAGLLIAHAARQMGAEYIKVYSEGNPSRLYGAQYLHQPIPGIPDLPFIRLSHQFKGTIEGYRAKVYGTEWDGVVSPEKYSGDSYAWDIRYAYDWLVKEYWDLYVEKATVNGWMLMGAHEGFWPMWRLKDRFDVIFSTIPRSHLCVNPDHQFKSAEIFAIGDAPELGITSPIACQDKTLVCSGAREDSWYRVCRVFGHSTAEWSTNSRKKPPLTGVARVQKPLATTCTCWPEISYQGRYGKWQKGVLVHHAYRDAIQAMQQYRSAEANKDASPV